MGSAYVNDFNILGRTYQVIAQADGSFRLTARCRRLKARNTSGEMVPIGSWPASKTRPRPIAFRATTSIPRPRSWAPRHRGFATGTALHRMEELAHEVLPSGIGFEWTELALQQQQPGTPTLLAVRRWPCCSSSWLLAAQYESWKLPLAVVLIVPMCLLASVTASACAGMPIDILAQIGFVVLVGLAAKNAILIVEFARRPRRPVRRPRRPP